MDGRNTFIEMYMEDMYLPVVNKVQNLTKKIDKQFKDYNIRGFRIERKKENLYSYMKNLAYKKFRKNHLIEIFWKNNINIFGKNELNKIRRTRSHKLPYHKKTYHTIIYRNLYNYKYRPYLFQLTKEDLSNKKFLNLTDYKKRKKRIKKRVFINPHLEMKIKTLTKINEKLKEKENSKIIQKIKVIQKTKSNPSLNNNFSYNKYLLNNWNNQRSRFQGKIPKLKDENTISNNLIKNNNSSNFEETTTNYKSILIKSKEIKKGKNLILPKIKEECVSTIKNLNKINNRLRVFKQGNKEKTIKEEINDNNLLNLNLPQLFKLFFIKKKNKVKTFKKKEAINSKEQSKNNNSVTSEKNNISNNKIKEKVINE